MRWLRTILAAGLAIGLAGAAAPALAIGGKQLKGVLETVHASDRHVVVRETGGRKGQIPLAVAKDAEIGGPGGPASFDSLHVGDEVTVHYRTGSHGEEATAIQVTKAVAAR
jgi:hypothetical protein